MAKGIGNGFPIGRRSRPTQRGRCAGREILRSIPMAQVRFPVPPAAPCCRSSTRRTCRPIPESRRPMKAVLERLHQKQRNYRRMRGHGLMLAIELVTDRKAKLPATQETAEIFEKTRENGLVVSKSGTDRNILRMVPPMCIQEADVASWRMPWSGPSRVLAPHVASRPRRRGRLRLSRRDRARLRASGSRCSQSRRCHRSSSPPKSCLRSSCSR